jgi:hypothetical protein
MKSFRATYHNSSTGKTSTMTVKATSLDAARREELKAMVMFSRINPSLSLVSVEAI